MTGYLWEWFETNYIRKASYISYKPVLWFNMIIHVVQAGETTGEIADKYGISEERLILDNNIQDPDTWLLEKPRLS